MTEPAGRPRVAVTFAGSGDAFGSGGRYQACIHLRATGGRGAAGAAGQAVLLDCGATSLSALKACGLDPGEIDAVSVSHQASLASGRTVLTHMSADMLGRAAGGQLAFETAHDGLTIEL